MSPTRRICRRNKQNGGGQGGAVSFAVPSFAPLVNNPLAFGTGSNCATSSGSNHQYAYPAHGLPGMNGGRRKGRQAGGAYGFDGKAGIVGGYPGAASYAPVSSIGCTGASPVAIPPNATDTLNKVGGVLWDNPVQRGGQLGQLGQLGDMKTAGYTTLNGSGSVIPTSAGSLVSRIIPVSGRMAGGRRSRKNRKNAKSRKSKSKSKSKSKHSKKRR